MDIYFLLVIILCEYRSADDLDSTYNNSWDKISKFQMATWFFKA